jgi:threonine/homoserine/homoserine lactone efflux protein
MDLSLLARGAVLGFSIAAPVGPIGVLVIRHSITHGRTAGLMTGLGAASADALYGLVGGLGVTAISSLLVRHGGMLRMGGAVFLLWLGIRTLLAEPAAMAAGRDAVGRARTFLTGLVLTISNPMTIVSFAAMFAGLGAGTAAGSGAAPVAWLAAGVFTGSAAWWLMLSGGASLLRSRMTPARLRWVNRGSGALIIGLAVAAFLAGG